MNKQLVLSTLLLLLCVLSFAQKTTFTTADGKIPYWPKTWPSIGYFASDNELGHTNEMALLPYEMRIVFAKQVSNEKIFFISPKWGIFSEYYCYFRIEDVSNDPRTTEYWINNMDFPLYSTLWNAVSASASTEEYPEVTRAIILDMINNKIVPPDVMTNGLTKGALMKAMEDYTKLVVPLDPNRGYINSN